MEKVVRIFQSFEEADAADIERDRKMTPEQRVAEVLQLRAWTYPDGTQQRLDRVYRIIQRERS
jgi:hypothetical protein